MAPLNRYLPNSPITVKLKLIHIVVGEERVQWFKTLIFVFSYIPNNNIWLYMLDSSGCTGINELQIKSDH